MNRGLGRFMKVLIVEDDPCTVESVSQALQMCWPKAQLSSTHLGRRGIELAKSGAHSIIILDLGLPDINGLEVLKQIRSFSSVPVVILTVKDEEVDKVKGLEWGADDYIVKPCGQLEFLARVKARIRDEEDSAEEPPVYFGTMCFIPSERQLLFGEKEINLTALESRILDRLIAGDGSVSTYSKLVEDVWGNDCSRTLGSLRVHIRRLRRKIEADPGHPRLICTKAGQGYFLEKPD